MGRERGIERRPVRRRRGGALEPPVDDAIAAEEPLEIRLAGEPLAVTMRTPGEDRALAVGFLFAEGVIGALEDVGGIAHCGRPGDEGWGNVIEVTPAPGVHLDPDALEGARRGTLTTASCGVCGRRTIDDLLARIPPPREARPIDAELLATAPDRLRADQARFAETGGVHAAALLTLEGAPLAHAEDVGRHNAVDKAVGAALYAGRLGDAAVLVVSGRVSFEIVQKAAAAGVAAVAAVSAPTTLAIDLAERAGLTLAAFVREGAMNLYSHADRVRGSG